MQLFSALEVAYIEESEFQWSSFPVASDNLYSTMALNQLSDFLQS